MNGMAIFLTVVFLVGIVGGGAGYMVATQVFDQQIDGLHQQVELLTSDNQGLRTALAASETEKQSLADALNNLDSARKGDQDQIQALTAQVAELRSQLAGGATAGQGGLSPVHPNGKGATLAELAEAMVTGTSDLPLDMLLILLFLIFAVLLMGVMGAVVVIWERNVSAPSRYSRR